MKKTLLMSLLMLAACSSIASLKAQDIKSIDLEDVIRGKLNPTTLYQLQWLPDGKAFVWESDNEMLQQDVKTGNRTTLFTLLDLNQALQAEGLDVIRYMPYLTAQSESSFRFVANNYYLEYDYRQKSVKKLTALREDAEDEDIEPHTAAVAYTWNDNVFINAGTSCAQLCNDGGNGIVNGKSVHRNEFGITKGTFWSPKGNLLAYYRMDERMVTDYPLVDLHTRIASLHNIKYPMAGEPSHHVTLIVYDRNTQKSTLIATGEPQEQYLTNITFSPDEQHIYILLLNRDQNHLKVNRYNVATGQLEATLFEETSDKFVEPQTPLYFLNRTPNQFLYLSQRDGYQHLYLYNTEGKLLRQVTKGDWVVKEFLGTDPTDKYAYFYSNKDNPVDNQLYEVEIKTGKVRRLTTAEGTHNVVFSPDKKYFIDTYTSTTIPRNIDLVNVQKPNNPTRIHTSANKLADYEVGEKRIFSIKNTNGDDLYCRMFMPARFDATQKYPVLVYVYGGPHSQLVVNEYPAYGELYFEYLTQKGYIVFTLDNRGTDNRGAAFAQATFHQLGTVEVEDQLAGIDYLTTLPYVDANRIGVDGWSFGGFMSLRLKTERPNLFKTCTAGGPVIDWKYYEIMYTERYMGTPQNNAAGYEKASLLNRIPNLNADNHVLIIHDTYDDVVMWQQSLLFVEECVKKQKQIDYFVYPHHAHNVRGLDRIHLWNKLTNYIETFLK